MSELAFASYADLSTANIRPSELVQQDFATLQASRFALEWRRETSYLHADEQYWIYDPSTGTPIGPYFETTGLAATVFKNISTGETVLAIRGTDDSSDVETDIVSIGMLGSTKYQGQYQILRQQVQEWIANGTLPQQFSVTGHSLGGFLATGLALEFPQYVDHAYLYNSPGLGGLTSRAVLDEIAHVYHITGGSYDPAKFTNVRAKPGTSLISGMGRLPSEPILVEGEDHGGLLIGTNNHSIRFLVDSLAVYDAFSGLSNGDAFDDIGRIIRGASDRGLAKLEGALDALRVTLQGGGIARTPEENRDALYQNLYALTDSTTYQGLLPRASISPIGRLGFESIASSASGTLGALVALRWLAPFQLGGVDADLAAAHAQLQASLQHDAALPSTRRSVDAQFSDAWRTERARMLWSIIARNEMDGAPAATRRPPVSRQYVDVESGTVLNTRPGDLRAAPVERVVFGNAETPNTLVGTSGKDSLFGGNLADTLDAGAGNDYLEGRQGSDILRGGGGSDRISGGEGVDQLFGDDDMDRLYGGDGSDTVDGGAADDTLDGGLQTDQLRGGDGYDTYVVRTGEGKDTILDSDARGRIDFVDADDHRIAIAGVGIADRTVANRWAVQIGSSMEVVATRNSPLTLTMPDGTQVVVDDERQGALGLTLLPDIVDQATTNTILGDRNADRRDTLIGTPANDRIDAGLDVDTVLGGAGADRILGGAGRDRLDGEAGDDVIEGGAEADIIEGGTGRDRLFADGAVTLDPLAAVRTALAFTGSPTNSQGDWLSGNDDADVLIGGLGNDGLAGGSGTDLLIGGAGDDALLGDADVAPVSGTWGWADVDVNGVLTRTFTGMDDGAVDPAGGASDSLYGGAGNDFALGGRGDDALFGADGDDFLQGDAGADVLVGGAGADRLAGDGSATTTGADQGNDSLDGGAGNDRLTGGGGGDELIGGDGDDVLVGDDTVDRVPVAFHGSDILDGGSGDDTLSGGLGDDEILGGTGNDTIAGDLIGSPGGGDDVIDAGTGNDLVDAGEGNDRVAGNAGDDQIDGSSGHDEIAGDAGDDMLLGAVGDDWLDGGLDDDVLYGGDGLDVLDGGEGDDTLSGGLDDDELLGALGRDGLHGDAGNDRLSGEDGEDWLEGGTGDDNLDGGADTDALAGGDGNDVLDGGGGKDLLMGGAGADRYLLATDGEPDFLAEIDASDTIIVPEGIAASALDFQRASDEFGNAGHLAIVAGNQLLAVALDCPDGARPTISLAGGTVIASATIDAAIARHPALMVSIKLPSFGATGSAATDTLTSPGGPSNLRGGAGDDSLTGGAANDILDGGEGADTLVGAAGADTLTGGIGDDLLDAGDDADTLEGDDGADRLLGGAGDDVVAGGTGNDTLSGDAGSDRISGGDGNDSIDGGAGRDTIAGDAGDDALVGGDGNDSLDGGPGNDTLSAGAGNDTLTGGTGNDLLDGGAGDDTFVLDGLGADRVRDAAGTSTIRFGAGITSASLTLSRGAAGSADEDALIVDFGGGNRAVIEDGVRGGPSRYTFADGTTLTRAQLLDARLASSLTLAADATHRTIAGGAGADTISAGTASAVDLRGGSGNDVVTGSAIADLLYGDAGIDRLTGNAGNDQLWGGAGNDVLEGGAGVDLASGGDGDDTFAPGDGDDASFGGAGNDTFGYDAGNDVARGGAGDDVYRFGSGAGYDVVIDAEGENRVRFAAGVRSSDVVFRTNGTSLVAALADGSRLFMQYAVAAPAEGVAQTRIAAFDFDGETLTLAQAVARATPTIDGDSPPSSLSLPNVVGATADDLTLDGAAQLSWNLRAYGGPGDDEFHSGTSFLFGRGDGHDTLSLTNPPSKQSPATLQSWIDMQPGIATSDLAFGIEGSDLIVTIRDTGDSVRVKQHFARFGSYPNYNYASAIAGLRFADGSTFGFDQIADAIGTGSGGDDRLGSIQVLLDDIRAGDGDDVVTLRETNAYVFGGDGNDTLSADPYLPGDASRLHGEAGNDVLVAGSSNNARTALYGGEGDDRLVGHPGAYLDGGTGNDRLELWSGATGGPIDVAFGRGSGHDSVTFGGEEAAANAPARFAVRTSEGSYRDLIVERDGEDLVLRVRDREDRFSVPDFFADGAAHSGLERIDVENPATGMVLPLLPDAASIAGRAIDAPGVAEAWVGTDANEVHVGAGGADALDGANGDDEIDGMSGDDTLVGGAGNDTLFGRSGQDSLDGGDGNDRLEGGRGDDVLRGGSGDDALVDAFGDNVAEGGDGADRVVLSGAQGLARGGAGNDSLSGAIGNHLLIGEAGDDTLNAWSGTVELDGGAGDDKLSISAAASAVVHFARGGGADVVDIGTFRETAIGEIRLGAGIAPAQVAVRREAGDLVLSIAGSTDTLRVRNGFSGELVGVARVTLADGGSLDRAAILALARVGTALDDELVGSAGDDAMSGLDGNDVLDGRAGNDTLSGGNGSDTIVGGPGNDLLDGNAGADSMRGNAGDDVYVLDDPGDTVTELAGEGTDEIRSSVTVYQPSTVERVRLTGTANIDAWGTTGNDDIAGNAGNNLLYARTGNDRLAGGAGDDSYSVADGGDTIVELANEGIDTVSSGVTTTLGANLENLWLSAAGAADGTGNALDNVLTGGDGANVLTGLAGNDTLDGGAGVDRLVGGTGNDSYVVDNAGDVVVELAGEGVDTVSASVSYVLPADVENALLVGSAANLTGNALANALTGTSLANVLDGGAGADAMAGGAGNDTYVVDDAGDTVIEASAAGTDTVQSSVSRTLAANVENLTLTGTAATNATGNSLANTLVGNVAANVLDGGAGNDTMRGGAGNDTYVVDAAGDVVTENASEGDDTVRSSVTLTLGNNVERLVLTGAAAINATGNTLANALTGNAANNVLDGKTGADAMAGGAGDDTYVVDNVADVVTENASEGTDLVQSAIAWTLASNVENLTLTGTANVNGTGNTLANTITGNAGNNILDGGASADTLRGGAGNDTYVVENAADVVTENASQGTDLVQASVSWTLAANVENLVLTGAAAINATGNTLANTLTGNAAANVLNGAAGADAMSGGAGDDVYVVDNAADVVTESSAAGTDRVDASIAWTLGANVENLALTGSGAIAGTGNTLVNRIDGNAAANVIDGKAGADTMAGGAGNDTYVVDVAGDTILESAGEGTDAVQAAVTYALAANVENLTLTGTAAINGTGNTLANTLTGNAAANLLDGGAGSDALRGGAGNDTYVVDVATDVVTENAGEGTDLVQASLGWTLGNEIENLTLTGSAAINGTGNALVNVIIGNAAANVLDGKAGADTLRGGAGDDTYVVDAGDVVTESANEGNDVVQSAITWTLGANLEDLVLTGSAAVDGTGNALSNALAGNAAANVLTGADGNDLAWGAAGNDTLAGGNGNDVLQGGDGNDSVGDTAANNLLDGGLGADTLGGGAGRELLIGGKGDDTISAGTGADVFALNKGDGKDTIVAAAGADDVLSLGGGIRYADLGMKKVGSDLVLDAGADQVTLKDWYAASSNHRIAQLQVVADASTDYLSTSDDPTRNRRIVRFDFAAIASAFDAALAANPSLTRWTVASALAGAYTGGSDSSALGGDLAYQYGRSGSLAGIGFDAAGTILGDAAFATAAQAFLPPATLGAGPRFLH